MESEYLPVSDNDEQPDDEEEVDDGPETSVEIDWQNSSEVYEVVSQGDDGFDRVTRPDYISAKDAAETHKSATGNECEINLL